MYYLLKLLISALTIVAVSEVSKKYSLLGGALASLPIVSVLAMVWLYLDTKDIRAVCQLSNIIMWMLIPSLVLFLVFPLLLKTGYNFYVSLVFSSITMAFCYLVTIKILKNFGIN
jgi:hypothetical protein